jgi:hypothetical protein
MLDPAHPDCGCREESDTVVICCGPHWVAVNLPYLHWPGHEDCCDVPYMTRLVAENGRETVEKGIEYYRGDHTQAAADYALTVLALVPTTP